MLMGRSTNFLDGLFCAEFVILSAHVNNLNIFQRNFLTFLTEDQSVIVSRVDKGEMVPFTTAFILASTSVRSEWHIRMTKSEVVLSETPKRLKASVI